MLWTWTCGCERLQVMNDSSAENIGPARHFPANDDPEGERTLWEDIGIPPPEYQDESTAPRVDRELLLAYERGELTREQRRKLHLLLDKYPSWADAHAKILVEKMGTAEFQHALDAALTMSDEEAARNSNAVELQDEGEDA